MLYAYSLSDRVLKEKRRGHSFQGKRNASTMSALLPETRAERCGANILCYVPFSMNKGSNIEIIDSFQGID